MFAILTTSSGKSEKVVLSGVYMDIESIVWREDGQGAGEFTVPGLGKLVKAERKGRMGRNPGTGEEIKIAAKTTMKFRIAKAASDAIAPLKS